MTTLTIGKLAAACDVKVDTVRYYERLGLLSPLERSNAGYRIYDPSGVDKLKFIRRTQTLGFTLEEIKDLLELSDRPDADCGDVRAQALKKIGEVETRIKDLKRIKSSLVELVQFCPGEGKPLSECNILQHFNGDEK